MGLSDFVCPREAFRVITDILRWPNQDPDGKRDDKWQGVQKVEVAFLASQFSVVADGQNSTFSVGVDLGMRT